ncbi:hypothetical protein I542_5531 [Mycobacteroides abscessus 1948]|uniref:Uncharacterized protein n=1 Tax=Mycobacteroides abscessus 1948 TaxID=1299323 RepID=A0A829QSA2_9MYCO|nr:hypothetical protein MA6G0728S_0322 [Mycobacteroides abscessus 6G-0728-S]EIV27680.1 hypothetical protein MA3A0119R_1365 [Mycobacteroides abscessus 3A-0119-R]EIV40939.1 hypothetical protein MA3A0731_1329 [Mycobacteroides abscessus 3A-0731]EIV41759.1 hypothetical protein MA3A0122S_0956 [Mycobacteroides abscessus 3A-0122-S]EIV55510.1 hypothetical protein MA3A0930S_1012 [Mycobacteroides abscessus 3A-0930-S]EIV83138.1 hypothetical protein MM3A0810R_1443 [Mycobacteroides abscessus 3A-0810-R]ETZ7
MSEHDLRSLRCHAPQPVNTLRKVVNCAHDRIGPPVQGQQAR